MMQDLNSLPKSLSRFLRKVDDHLRAASGAGAEMDDHERRRVLLDQRGQWNRATQATATVLITCAAILLSMLAIAISALGLDFGQKLFIVGMILVVTLLVLLAVSVSAPQASSSARIA